MRIEREIMYVHYISMTLQSSTLLAVLVLFVQCVPTQPEVFGEVFSATEHLKRLHSSQRLLLQHMERYVQRETARLQHLARSIDEIRSGLESSDVSGMYHDRAMHPIWAYHIIDRWYPLHESVISREAESAFRRDLTDQGLPIVKHHDFVGATDAILRLQKVYNLSSTALAAGDILGYAVPPMSTREMHQLSDRAMRNGDNSLSLSWLEEAALRDSGAMDTAGFLIDFARAYFRKGDFQKAIELGEKAHNLDPESNQINSFLTIFRRHIESGAPLQTPDNFYAHKEGVYTKYEELCRSHVHYQKQHKHFCRYRLTEIPIIRFKEEVLSVDPWIALIHNVISDDEIEQVIATATPRLERAHVGNPKHSESSRDRVGKVGWLWESEPGGLALRLNKRVELITGLSTTERDLLSSSEALQVVNYGIAGQYEPHHDYYDNPRYIQNLPRHLKDTGDRLATFMFYLSDVLAGGATVFPIINVRVPAVKNAAVFWYNIQRSGEKDVRTKHAGCPVLLGEKWVANKWIREYGQHFNHPCGLSEHDTEMDIQV